LEPRPASVEAEVAARIALLTCRHSNWKYSRDYPPCHCFSTQHARVSTEIKLLLLALAWNTSVSSRCVMVQS